MSLINIPTSKDIYIEVNGEKIAVAQSYYAKTTRESKYIEAFGQDEPVATVGGKINHTLTLSRVMVSKGAIGDKIDFYNLSDFNVVIVKPNSKIIYTGCEWADIDQSVNLNQCFIEKVTIVAAKRMEI